ncbi:hypothetical protein CKO31_25715 [Thiohalocapsa halophila]|uniref:Integrase catalytic domain-containing protein n=2 Tax=Thiohalocapsa halophila TaxID=69359 RepID=A0ABS1CQ41_9GAMM|nr:hypothetical protein [Thiohalocapsa halophila]
MILPDGSHTKTEFCNTRFRHCVRRITVILRDGGFRLCAERAIEDRLMKPAHPQTNGIVERSNRRIAELLATNRFGSGEHLEYTLQRCAALYNHDIPQSNLCHSSPVQALIQRQAKHPELFVAAPNNLPGPDT